VLLAIAAGVVLLVALVINGVVSAASSSTGYVQLVNRSFVSEANAIFASQKPSGSTLETLLTSMDRESRLSLQLQLDSLVTDTTNDAKAAETTGSPAPSADLGPRFAEIVAKRAQAMVEIRSVVDGLLGMSALPVAGSPTKPPATPVALLTTGEATSRLSQAGSLLLSADRAVGPLRARALSVAGHPRMSRSVFIADHSLLTPTAMASLVAALETSPSLAVVHQLSILTYSLSPSILPTPNATTANLPPTSSLAVTAVVLNRGTVDERGVRVTATVTPVSGGVSDSKSAVTAVGTGGAASVKIPALKTTPGSTVSLTISITPPPGQGDQSGLSQTLTVFIGPSTTSLG
jgi:hypothetical protein